MPTEVAARADFSRLRYAQCWEDADVLLEGLDIREGDVCVAIASAGDNVLAMLSRKPARVIAVDLSPAQLACLTLKTAAYRVLNHPELLELMGSRPSAERLELYRRCRHHLSLPAKDFWDARPRDIACGIGSAGKFERYLALFRRLVLPAIHSRQGIARLLSGGDQSSRERFYDQEWDTRLWRLLFRIFCSRFVIGRIGRDPEFFRYVDDDVPKHLSRRFRHASTALDPSENPYLHWMLEGRHGTALPYALRPENFEAIRGSIDRLEMRYGSLEDCLEGVPDGSVDRYNLSNIFEYMSLENYHQLLARLVRSAGSGCRLAYWNLFVPRRRPTFMGDRLRSLDRLASELHAKDKAFIYGAFVVEEVV